MDAGASSMRLAELLPGAAALPAAMVHVLNERATVRDVAAGHRRGPDQLVHGGARRSELGDDPLGRTEVQALLGAEFGDRVGQPARSGVSGRVHRVMVGRRTQVRLGCK